MNNLLKSAARKHALANGIATAKWGDEEFQSYVDANGITERDNLKSGSTVRVEKVETVETTVKPEVKVSGNVEKAIADLVAGLSTKQELDEQRVIALIAKHSSAPRLTTVEIKQQDKIVATREGVHKDYPIVLAHIAAGVNIAAVGPAGSGKSTMFEQIAEDLGLEYYFQGAVQQEFKIMGYQDANGVYHRTQFRDAYENGGLFVMEEYDGSAAKALLAINNAVAGNWCDFPDGKIAKHEKFVCVMAGNTFGMGASRQYVGRTQLDAATLDRFAFIEIGYDEAMERAATLKFNEDAGNWVTEVQSFRKKVAKAGIRHVVSPRASIMGAKLLKQGLPHEVVVKTCLHKGLTADQIAQLAR